MRRKRSKNLDDATTEQVVQILDGWHNSKLTWDLLIEQVMLRTFNQYSRQALNNSVRVKNAYKIAKERLDGEKVSSKRKISKELQIALARKETLKAENCRLIRENDQLLEQFCRWAYNASNRGISEEFLNQPLPKVDRGQTKEKKLPDRGKKVPFLPTGRKRAKG
ncbi:hypothetical protein LJC36_01285 [Desulfovibrio sp. OttesenSCG-928-C14]|nr:hypothetical protein [Desulfovibrio sp. OttesenSCG-928-C14]